MRSLIYEDRQTPSIKESAGDDNGVGLIEFPSSDAFVETRYHVTRFFTLYCSNSPQRSEFLLSLSLFHSDTIYSHDSELHV